MGANNFDMSFEARGKQTCGRDIPGFWLGYHGGAQKVREKGFLFYFCPLVAKVYAVAVRLRCWLDMGYKLAKSVSKGHSDPFHQLHN